MLYLLEKNNVTVAKVTVAKIKEKSRNNFKQGKHMLMLCPGRECGDQAAMS